MTELMEIQRLGSLGIWRLEQLALYGFNANSSEDSFEQALDADEASMELEAENC